MRNNILSGIVILIIFNTIFIVLGNGYDLMSKDDLAAGCYHNGTVFANGSLVPTMEPCLNCKCINSNLICSLRVCPEQPIPPPRGCIVVQKRDACCPYLSCSKLHTSYKGDNRKVITYDRKWYEENIRDRIFNQNTLLRRIDDGFDQSDENQFHNEKMCIHNGTVYRSGSAMSTSSLCSYCYCIGGRQKCIKPKCLLPAKGCEPVLIDSACCPIRYDCSGNSAVKARFQKKKENKPRSDNKHYLRMTSRTQRSRGCLVDSVFYPEGEKLPADSTNPCEICFCIRGSKRCTPKKCSPSIRNCKPMIPEGQCCPASYDCDYSKPVSMAREFTARQYDDFFSLLFGDVDTENATAQANDASDSISVNGNNAQSLNEKNLLDALREGLNYMDKGENSVQNTSNVPFKSVNETFETTANGNIEIEPTTDGADVGDEEGEEDESDDDEEGISILDYFLNGAQKLDVAPTTPKQNILFVQPNSNATKVMPDTVHIQAMTNGLMHIRPVMAKNPVNSQTILTKGPVRTQSEGSLHAQLQTTRAPVRTQTEVTKGPLRIQPEITKRPVHVQSEITKAPTHIYPATVKVTPNIHSTVTKAPIIVQPAITIGPTHTPSSITNSPMHIQPVLPQKMKNETVKFALLPMSLYNMVKDDGTILFEKMDSDGKIITSKPANKNTVVSNEWTITASDVTATVRTDHDFVSSTPKTDFTITSNIADKYATLTTGDAITDGITMSTANIPKHKFMSTKGVFDTSFTTEQLPTEIRTETAINLVSNWKTVDDRPSTTEDFTKPDTTTRPAITAKRPTIKNNLRKQTTNTRNTQNLTKVVNEEKIIISPVAHLPDDSDYNREIVVKYSTNFGNSSKKPMGSTLIVNPLTTVRPSSSKPIIINSNPLSSIESDVNYDYSEPTLPPSLPNLKIIPFLPTDAVKNLVHTNRVKSNYNYYQSNASPYSDVANNQNVPVKYSTFSQPTTEYPKPITNKYPTYSVKPTANDRIDYYGYGAEHKESLDYGLYSPFGGGNINTKLDYELYDQHTYRPSKLQTTSIKNIVEKNPYETDYDLYDQHTYRPSKLQTTSIKNIVEKNPYGSDYDYDVYHLHASEKNRPNFNMNYIPVQQSGNGVYSSDTEVPFRVPEFEKFATIRPDNKYGFGDIELRSALDLNGKNKFSPPAKTEGGFVPKRPSDESYYSVQTTNAVPEATTEINLKGNDSNVLVKTGTNHPTPFKNLTEALSSPSVFHTFKESIKFNDTMPKLNLSVRHPVLEFDKDVISITTDTNYNISPEYGNAFIALDLNESDDEKPVETSSPGKNNTLKKPEPPKYSKMNSTKQFVLNVPKPIEHADSKEELLNNLFGFIFKDEDEVPSVPKTTESPTVHKSNVTIAPLQNNSVPLKLLTILNSTKKDSLDKTEPPQRKNNKIIDSTSKLEKTTTPVSIASATIPEDKDSSENLTILRDVLLATLNNPSVDNVDDLVKGPSFLQTPINKTPFIDSHSTLTANTNHPFQSSPIRSDLDLIIPELSGKTDTKLNHNNINPDNYHVLPEYVTGSLTNTESYVVNPVDVDKLKQHHSEGETRIFTKPLKDPAGILKLAGCNIYGRMYRVGRIISELSGPCLECRCTEVGVSCTPLPC